MTIDSTTSLEVRPLVLQSVVENGEAVVTLAESSTIDLHTLNVQNQNYEILATNIIGNTVTTASVFPETVQILLQAVLDPTVDFQDPYIQGDGSGWQLGDLRPYALNQQFGVDFGDGPTKTYRLYLKIASAPEFSISEDGQKIINIQNNGSFEIYGSLRGDIGVVDSSFVVSEYEMQDGVSYPKTFSTPQGAPSWQPLLGLINLKIDAAELIANPLQTGDIIAITFACRTEGHVSTPKLTGLNAPVDGADAVNLDYVTAEAAALSATNAAQIDHIDSEVAILLDKIVNQDSIEVVSAERWTSPKAVVMEGQVQGTQVLANFNTSVANEADQSIKIAKKSFRVVYGNTSIADPNFQLSDVNNDLAPGFYKLVVAASNQCGQFPSCSYGNRGYVSTDQQENSYNSIFEDCNDNPMTFDVRYYANQAALNDDVYTVVASSVVSQGKVIVNAETFPNWEENPYNLSGPSYVTVVEGTTANAGYVNTIPGFFSWYCKNNRLTGDNSPMSMWITEMPAAGSPAVILEVVDSLQISETEPKFGTGCLVLDGGEKSFVRIMNDDKGMNFSGGNFCVEGWFKFDPANTHGAYKLFSLGNDIENGYNGQGEENPLSISIYHDSNGNWETIDLGYSYRTQSGQTDYLGRSAILRDGDGEGASIVDNQWHHIALVFENGVFKVYVDGVAKVTEINEALDLNSYLDFSNIFIGGDTKYLGSMSNMIGSVDCLRITVGAPVYTSNFTPSTTPLKFNLTGLGISFPDMRSISLKSTSLGVVLANPPVDTSDMTTEEFADSMRRKLYTANVVKNIVGSWQTPEGEVFVGPNGDLVEQAPASGRIIRIGKKLNATDLLIDMQDYGFINAITTKKKNPYGPLTPAPVPLGGYIARLEHMGGIQNNGDMDGIFSVKILKASQAKYYLVTFNYEISEYTVMDSGIINLYDNEYDGVIETISLPQGNFFFVVGVDSLVDLPLADWHWDDYLRTEKSKYVQVYNQSANTEISLIQVNGMIISEGGAVSVPFTNSVDVQVLLSASSSYVDYINGASGMSVGENQVEIRVVSLSGIATSRYITVYVNPPSSNTNLSSIQVNGTVVAENGTISVPFTTSVTVTATPEDSNASIEYVMGNTGLVVGDNTVEISVIAQDGSGAKRYITVVVGEDTNLSTFTINGTNVVDGDTFNVLYGTTSVVVGAIPSDPNSTVTITGGNNLVTGNNQVIVNVTNAGYSTDYTVIVVVAPISTNTNLSTFKINGINVVDGGSVAVPNLTSVTVTAVPQHPSATIASISGDTGLVVGNNTLQVQVQSQAGTTKNYVVTIKVIPIDHEITNIQSASNPFYPDNPGMSVTYTPNSTTLNSGAEGYTFLWVERSLNGGESWEARTGPNPTQGWTYMNPIGIWQKLVNNSWIAIPSGTYDVKLRLGVSKSGVESIIESNTYTVTI